MTYRETGVASKRTDGLFLLCPSTKSNRREARQRITFDKRTCRYQFSSSQRLYHVLFQIQEMVSQKICRLR